MVRLEQMTTQEIENLPLSDVGKFVFDKDLEICKIKNNSGLSQVLSSDNNGLFSCSSLDGTTKWGFRVNTDHNLEWCCNGHENGTINANSNINMMNFTGQHRSFSNNSNIYNNIEYYKGLIVSCIGNHKNMNNINLNVNDAIPIVDITTIDNDKKVLGVISSCELSLENRTFQIGIFSTKVEKNIGDERLIINALGEGMVWVCDKNGNFSNGDLITTSSSRGYGQLQLDDLIHNYTVGKITQNCNFSSPERYIDLNGNEVSEIVYNSDPNNHRKCNLVACIYYSG